MGIIRESVRKTIAEFAGVPPSTIDISRMVTVNAEIEYDGISDNETGGIRRRLNAQALKVPYTVETSDAAKAATVVDTLTESSSAPKMATVSEIIEDMIAELPEEEKADLMETFTHLASVSLLDISAVRFSVESVAAFASNEESEP